jgi:nucleotide-binding universal stress UspA family protein
MAGLIPAVLQLIVVGSHGRGWFAALLSGSTGRALIRSPACPVAVTR